MFYGNKYISDSGTLPLPSIIKSKPVDENLIEAAVRNTRVDGINVNICRLGMFEWALCEVVASL